MTEPLRWQVGDVRITRVVELCWPVGLRYFFSAAERADLEAHREWLVPHFVNEAGRLLIQIQTFVVESRGRTILVDTCVGNDKERSLPEFDHRQGSFLADLAAAGFAPGDVDVVLCTHMHVDHVGWNTHLADGRWVPTFPEARHLFARVELEHWSKEGPSDFGDVFGDSVQPILDAGLADVVEADHPVTDEVRLESTPGHTPGHVSVRIRSGGREAVITGDLMHSPIQCAHPEWEMIADVDPDEAVRTRRRFLAAQADRDVLVLGTHFAGPTAGSVRSEGGVWRFEASDR